VDRLSASKRISSHPPAATDSRPHKEALHGL
jgi:hypothetical protein